MTYYFIIIINIIEGTFCDHLNPKYANIDSKKYALDTLE